MKEGNRMPRMIDMTGWKFGELTVLLRAASTSKQIKWLCRCSCGNVVAVQGGNLRSGHSKSCGRCNMYEQEGDYIKCTVHSGKSFIFDKADLELVKSKVWSVDKNGYVLSADSKLHRFIMGNPDGVVDHINGNPSDCRRSNLRCATQRQNTYNAGISKNSTTGYKGVCFDKRRKRYMAHIHPDGKTKFLGYYDNPREAAMAYDQAASLLFGEFARLNFGGKCG
jgi:hypothetical protein